MFERRRRLRPANDHAVLVIDVDGDPSDAVLVEAGHLDGRSLELVVLPVADQAGAPVLPRPDQRVLLAGPHGRWMLATVARSSSNTLVVHLATRAVSS